MKVACITAVRNDRLFLRKWIDYYGRNFGRQSLFVLIDGLDEPIPAGFDGVNFLQMRHRDWAVEISNVQMRRAAMDHARSRAVSSLAGMIWRYDYDAVIATDVDEFLIADPARYESLAAFMSAVQPKTSSLSGLGIDVIHNLSNEPAVDESRPFLSQRSTAVVSSAYTKPVLAFRPVTWGAGFHRIKHRNFHIHSDLYLFHFGMVDYETAMGRVNDPDLIAAGWGPHLQRREAMFRKIETATPVDADQAFALARQRMTWRRKIFAWNKPATLLGPPIISIPKRFGAIV